MDREVAALEDTLEAIWDIATSRFGLDPFPVRFEIVPSSVMYEIGSYALPGRYSHWSFGKAYHKMKTSYDLGLSRIYEVVINSNPSYAFLLDTNTLLQNKLVIAHVLGHADFFKNNAWFAPTNRQMLDDAQTHAARISDYEFRFGRKPVEDFLDSVISIEEHIDPDFFIKPNRQLAVAETEEDRGISEETSLRKNATGTLRGPEKDLVWFIAQNSPTLKDWQRDVMSMIHDEMLYFVPQMQTKIMNEGWASIWHSRILRELDLPEVDYLEFAELHSGVISPQRGKLNPYHLGYKIFEDIERRWNESASGSGAGTARMFEVRELDNDVSFLRNYLTEDLCKDLDLFVYDLDDDDRWKVSDTRWERVRDQLVANMTNFGFPYIEVVDGDYNGNRELFLMHRHEGVDLDQKYARKVLEHVFKLWGRTVYLETRVDGDPVTMRFDGKLHAE
jgi:stage V sporulation protein R